MRLLKQSDTTKAIVFLMVDSTDHITGKTGLSPTVTISKNGGSFVSPTGTVSEIGNGWYKLVPSSDDVGTLGPLIIHASATGADPADIECQVVSFDPYCAISGAVVSDGANSETSFKTDLSGTYATYRGMFLLFTSGSNQGVAREVVDFDSTGKFIEVNVDFPVVPSAGDQFILAGYSGR